MDMKREGKLNKRVHMMSMERLTKISIIEDMHAWIIHPSSSYS